MIRNFLRLAVLAGIAAVAVGTGALLAPSQTQIASAQVICADGSMNCPVVVNSGFAAYPSADIITVAPSYVTYTPAYSAPAAIYVAPASYAVTTQPVVTVGPIPDYVSVGGSYCTMAGGGQVWVPAGTSPGDVGC